MAMANRIIRILDRALDTLIVIVCILLLLIGVYSMLDNLWLYQNAQDRSILQYRPELDKPLSPERRISEKQVGWVRLDDTSIDYPLMQGEDNYEYLNKNPYGEFSLSGSIFLDSRNDPLFRDDYSLVYGHHMDHGAMFGALDAYEDKDYFDKHRTGTIVTGDAVYAYTLFAVSAAEATDNIVFNPADQTTSTILAFLKQNAMTYTEPEEGLRIVALSTCSGDASLKRLIVFGTIAER